MGQSVFPDCSRERIEATAADEIGCVVEYLAGRHGSCGREGLCEGLNHFSGCVAATGANRFFWRWGEGVWYHLMRARFFLDLVFRLFCFGVREPPAAIDVCTIFKLKVRGVDPGPSAAVEL